jgi:hypothetical protein
MLARVLGEAYRLQLLVKPNSCPVSDATIYGLLEGIEPVIDEAFDTEPITMEHINAVASVLDPIFHDADRLERFRGFYDIERDLELVGIDRSLAIKVLRYFHADGRYKSLIAKMDSTGSPVECRTFELDEWHR